MIGKVQRAERGFSLLCREMLANFEGQLTTNPDQLEVQDAEYQEILRQLLPISDDRQAVSPFASDNLRPDLTLIGASEAMVVALAEILTSRGFN